MVVVLPEGSDEAAVPQTELKVSSAVADETNEIETLKVKGGEEEKKNKSSGAFNCSDIAFPQTW